MIKISAAKVYTSVFVIILLLQLYVPSFKINTAFQIAALLMFFVMEKVSLSVAFIKEIKPFIYLILIGFVGTIVFQYDKTFVIKDIAHFIKPITGLLIGYLFYKRIGDYKLFAQTIVGAGILSAIIHLLIIKFMVQDTPKESIHQVREFTKDNLLELFSLFTLIYYKKFHGKSLFRNKPLIALVYVLLIVSIILYFSRTMIIVAVILAVSFSGYTILTKKTMKIAVIGILAIGLFYTYLYSTNIRRNGRGIEAFLYKVKIAPEEVFKSNVSIANKKALWDHWRGYEASRAMYLMEQQPSSYVFGTGMGSLINLKFYAPLSDDKKGLKYISELHNGYVYILYKTGIIGLLIYLFVMARWYLVIYQNRNFINMFISAIGIFYLVSTLTITGVYNTRDIGTFILGGLLFFMIKDKREAIEQ